jgi:hypothetical protein
MTTSSQHETGATTSSQREAEATTSSQRKAGATTPSQHEGRSNNIIIIMGQQNEVGLSTTFCGTLTIPKELPRNHKIPYDIKS